MNGGKLCEVVYTILRGYADGQYPTQLAKPKSMLDACKALEHASNCPRSVRIQIPRMLIALYEIRNNRGVGHAGGDVSPNAMDAAVVVSIAKWIMAELVRLFHKVSLDEAQRVVETLTERSIPIVWEVGNTLRVLDTSLTMRDKMLLLLYRASGPVEEAQLVRWVEHSNPSVFRRDVIMKAHQARLVEYDRSQRTIQISPVGISHVESRLALEIALPADPARNPRRAAI